LGLPSSTLMIGSFGILESIDAPSNKRLKLAARVD